MTDPLVARLAPRDYREVARYVIGAPTYEWIRSGSGDGFACDNEAAFRRRRLRSRVLVDVSAVSTATTVLGAPIAAPVMIGPMGLQRAVHPDGELAMAEGAARAGSLLVVAVNATTSIEDIAAASAGPAALVPALQLGRPGCPGRRHRPGRGGRRPGHRARSSTRRSTSTTPRPQIGFRLPATAKFAHFDSSPENTGSNTWEYLAWLRSVTSLPIVPKGIMTGDDAARAVDAGASGIIVSNHGGRQLERSISTLDALPEVVEGAGSVEVYLDGGVRTGGDILVALALGARAVLVGRPAMWGLAVGGADGVARVLDTFRQELADDAGLCGLADATAVPRDIVVDAAG